MLLKFRRVWLGGNVEVFFGGEMKGNEGSKSFEWRGRGKKGRTVKCRY